MARTIFNQGDAQELDTRLTKLRPDSQPQFGKMTAPEMVCHMKDSLEVATGVAPASSKDSIMSNPFVRWFIIYHLPWPKAKAQTVPEMLKTKPAEWESDLLQLRRLLHTTASRGASATWARHPAFGEISGRDYGTLIFRHFDHHLGQFGV
jgi:hypothetical protein